MVRSDPFCVREQKHSTQPDVRKESRGSKMYITACAPGGQRQGLSVGSEKLLRQLRCSFNVTDLLYIELISK